MSGHDAAGMGGHDGWNTQPTPNQSLIGMAEPKCRQGASGTARAARGTRIRATRLHNADRDSRQAYWRRGLPAFAGNSSDSYWFPVPNAVQA